MLYNSINLVLKLNINGGDYVGNNTNKNSKGLGVAIMSYINGDNAKLESNIIDVEKSKENYIKSHEGVESPKFKFFDYTMNTYLILFAIISTLTILFTYLFVLR